MPKDNTEKKSLPFSSDFISHLNDEIAQGRNYSDAFANAMGVVSSVLMSNFVSDFEHDSPKNIFSIGLVKSSEKTKEGKRIVTCQPKMMCNDRVLTNLGAIELTLNQETGNLENATCTNPIFQALASGKHQIQTEPDVMIPYDEYPKISAPIYYDLIKRGESGSVIQRIALLKEIATTYHLPFDLTSMDLRGADLRGADLSGADLRGVDLTGANLGNANLSGAILTGVNFKKANIEGAVFNKATIDAMIDFRGAKIAGLTLTDPLTCTVLDPYNGKETSKATTVSELYAEVIKQLVVLRHHRSPKMDALFKRMVEFEAMPRGEAKNKFASDELIKVLMVAHKYPDEMAKKAFNNAIEKVVQGAPLASVAVEQTPSKQQTLFGHDEINPVIFNSALIKESEGVTVSQYTNPSSNIVDVAQLKGHDQRIIVHPTLYNTQADLTQYFKEIGLGMLASPAEKVAAEKAAQVSAVEQTQAVVTPREPEFVPLKEPLQQDDFDVLSDVDEVVDSDNQNQVVFSVGLEQSEKPATEKTIHIIPEVGMGLGKENQHIRLRVVTQEIGQTFQEAFQNSDVFDPRRAMKPGEVIDSKVHTLKVQNLKDDTNCGRYVAAMAIQAAGLAKDGVPITVDTLKASPAVKRALHFSSSEDAQAGLKNTYVRPLAYCKTNEDKMAHYKQVLLCLKSEYESRVKHPDRAFHGEAIFGKYSPAGIFTKLLGHSAEDKLKAVKAIEKVLLHRGNVLNLDQLPAAAKQGMLGDCVKGMIATQDEHRKTFSP